MRPTPVRDDFRYDILATEMAFMLTEVVKRRGLPSRVTMCGIPTKEVADQIHDALVAKIVRIEESWQRPNLRVRFYVVIEPGKTERVGYDVVFQVEEGKEREQVLQGPKVEPGL